MFFLSLSLFLSAQNVAIDILRSDSPTFNEFRHHSASLDQVEAYADKIYPRGRIILDSENAATLEFDDIPSLLGADPGSSFSLTSKRVSKLNPNKVYYQYQQFHQGIQVDNGGYTILAAPPGAVGGCNQSSLYGISPAIATGINVNTTATISQAEAAASVGNNLVIINTSELSIVWGLTEEDTYHLVYKVDYLVGNEFYRVWVNAHNGSIFKKIDISMNLLAGTLDYCVQDLNDSQGLNDERILITEDGVVKTYFFVGSGADSRDITDYLHGLIPTTNTTTNSEWWWDENKRMAYQAHFCASNIVPAFNDLIEGIDEFTDVKIGIDRSYSNASVLPGSLISSVYMQFSGFGAEEWFGHHGFFGVNDMIGHELAHVFLNDYLDRTTAGNRSLHEAFADIFGTYLESVIQIQAPSEDLCLAGEIDWIIGDDNSELEESINRDLENPAFTTWQEVAPILHSRPHDRSVVLSHWYYMISEGMIATSNGTPNYQPPIPALGAERAIEIVIEGLLALDNPSADYPDFMEAVEMAVDLNWGICSQESAAVRRAFKRIGLGDGETCAYVHIKPRYCESDAAIQLCIEEGFSDDLYRWYFPNDWTVQGAGNINSVNGNCLKVLDWPEYDYYPRNFTVRLYNVTKNISVMYNIRMEDCEGDDPTCNDVELNAFSPSHSAEARTDNLNSTDSFILLRVFDINGRKVYEGQNFREDFVVSNLDGLMIYCYYDHQGKIVKTKKMAIIK